LIVNLGTTKKCRILQADITRDRLMLTVRPSLVDTKRELLSDYENISIGTVADGIIAMLQKANGGALVTFYGNCKGWLPAKVREIFLIFI
jgi:ribosomal protein S1